MATMAAGSEQRPRGGAFLVEERTPAEVFTPEDFNDEQKAIARAADEFASNEIEPRIDAIEHQEPGVATTLLRKSAELGFTSTAIPERFGGMETDLVSDMLVAEHIARSGSYAAWHGAHTGIGTWPILLFGTEDQKQRYLPKLATAEWIAAYALTEPHAGSDALAARTRADLAGDGTHYVLSGQKMWITNGGAADLFIVFAKVGGEKFTAFLVERSFPGVTTGAEEKKMGIKGSSTVAVYFDSVPVPASNVLGEIGRGHVIAFNILNIGRLKLGPFVLGGAKSVLAASLKYAKERQAFGKPIAAFGLIRHKLAEMAIRIFAAESMVWRTVGLIEARLGEFSWSAPDAAATMLKAVEEYAAECSMVKVFASDMLDYVTDEGVQIHGGYGYHQDYSVERAYRDSRINRIFEGTNEINRLLITGMLLKRAERGQLPLAEAAAGVLRDITSPSQPVPEKEEPERLVRAARKIALLCLGVAYQRYLKSLEEQQEILAAISDIITEVYGMESVLLRVRKMAGQGRAELASDIAAVWLGEGIARIETHAREVLAFSSEGDALRVNLAVLRRFARYEPVDAIGIRRRIAGRLLEAERYAF